MKTNVRSTSLDTYREINESGLTERTTEQILECLRAHGRLTRSQVSSYTGLNINQVTGRVKEMLKQKRLHEDDEKIICPITGYHAKRIYIISIKSDVKLDYIDGQMTMIF